MAIRDVRGAVAMAAIGAVTLAGCNPNPSNASLSAFVGTWQGHTRLLVIDKDGAGRESVGDGCCHPIIDVAFTLDSATGTPTRATARGTITAVKIKDARELSDPVPAVGQHLRLTLRDGIITESATEQIYCDTRPHAKVKQAFRCGA